MDVLYPIEEIPIKHCEGTEILFYFQVNDFSLLQFNRLAESIRLITCLIIS